MSWLLLHSTLKLILAEPLTPQNNDIHGHIIEIEIATASIQNVLFHTVLKLGARFSEGLLQPESMFKGNLYLWVREGLG